jgi:hypothetical protein
MLVVADPIGGLQQPLKQSVFLQPGGSGFGKRWGRNPEWVAVRI